MTTVASVGSNLGTLTIAANYGGRWDILQAASQLVARTVADGHAVPVDEALRDTESMIAPQVLAKGLHYSYKGAGKSASVLADPEKLANLVMAQ